jgi:YVTN family beta-propeller protein
LGAGGMHLWGILKVGKTLFVTHVQDHSVAAIDQASGAVEEIAVGAMPCALAVDEARGELFVVSYGDGVVTAIDARSKGVLWSVSVGGHPQAITVDAERGRVYVADAQAAVVRVIEEKTRRVVKTVAVEGHPYALAVEGRTHRVFAAAMDAKGYAEIER